MIVVTAAVLAAGLDGVDDITGLVMFVIGRINCQLVPGLTLVGTAPEKAAR